MEEEEVATLDEFALGVTLADRDREQVAVAAHRISRSGVRHGLLIVLHQFILAHEVGEARQNQQGEDAGAKSRGGRGSIRGIAPGLGSVVPIVGL